MSFMFNPHPFDDMSAINRPKISKETATSIVCGLKETAKYLSGILSEYFKENKNRDCCILAMDGYISAQWEQTINLIIQNLKLSSIDVSIIDISKKYKSSELLEKQFEEYLPKERKVDPVLLFGRLIKKNEKKYEYIFDSILLEELKRNLEREKTKKTGIKKVIIVYGCGAALNTLRSVYDYIAYFDVTPKQVVLRAKNGMVKNLGDTTPRPFNELMRRLYYIDFELAMALRGELLKNGEIDFYIASDVPEDLKLIPKEALNEIMSSLVKYPFRCKPVYIEGVWGGQFIKKVRSLPNNIRNCAWSFELIPLEVSLLVEVGNNLIEFPFFTFVQKEGIELMGKDCVKKFGGYFPIRFNYDDTYHSSGNMSIQVHPTDEYIKEHFNEFGRQDESYYVIVTGHEAKTYLGFKENANVDEFLSKIKTSEVKYTSVDYDTYVNSIPSKPGMQFLIPAGTIHASGRNQVVLEIGSLTVGSYTFKLYDYLRKDLDGKLRPIHSYHGERVLKSNRRTEWVNKNLVQEPKLVRKGEGWAEYIIGEHDLIYFSLRRLEFEREIEDNTNGKFHVLTFVDGEKAIIQSIENPERCYYANFLDVVVVPANIGRYVIKNLGNQPIIMHKTMLKDGFEDGYENE